MLTNSEETLDADEIEMLQGIFRWMKWWRVNSWCHGRMPLWLIFRMIPRKSSKVSSSKFLTIPVYDGDKDNVIGLIHTKRLLNEALRQWVRQSQSPQILQSHSFVLKRFRGWFAQISQVPKIKWRFCWMSMVVWQVSWRSKTCWKKSSAIEDETDKGCYRGSEIGEYLRVWNSPQ